MIDDDQQTSDSPSMDPRKDVSGITVEIPDEKIINVGVDTPMKLMYEMSEDECGRKNQANLRFAWRHRRIRAKDQERDEVCKPSTSKIPVIVLTDSDVSLNSTSCEDSKRESANRMEGIRSSDQ